MQNIKWLVGFFILTVIFYIYDLAPAMQDLKLMHATERQLQKELHEKNNKMTKNKNHLSINYLDLHQNELIDFFIKHSVASGMSIHAIDCISQHQKNQLKTIVFKIAIQSHGYGPLVHFVDQITSDKYFLNIEELNVNFINDVNVECRLRIVVTNVLLHSLRKESNFPRLNIFKMKNGVTKIVTLKELK